MFVHLGGRYVPVMQQQQRDEPVRESVPQVVHFKVEGCGSPRGVAEIVVALGMCHVVAVSGQDFT